MYKRMQNFWQLTTLEQCKLTCYCQPGRLGTSCSPSHCTSYYRINTMLWITKLDNCSYQAHWSAWRCCLLKKSSTRRSKPLLWSRESSHPFLCCQSSLMPLWNLAMKRLHRAVWDMHRRCMGECKPLNLLPWNSICISLCLWQVPQIVCQEFPHLHVQTWPIAATNRKLKLSNRWDFPTPRIFWHHWRTKHSGQHQWGQHYWCQHYWCQHHWC